MARPPWPPHHGHAAVNITPSSVVPWDMPRSCLVSNKISVALLSTTRHYHRSAAMTKPAVTVAGGVESSWSPFDLLAMAVAASGSSCAPPISGTATTTTTPPLAGVRGPPPPRPANWSRPATMLTSPRHPPWQGQAFAHLNCTPAPLEGLTGELTTGGSTPGKKMRIFLSPATRPCTWCT